MRGWIPLLYIWGLQGLAAGLLEIASVRWPVGHAPLAVTIAALALSAVAAAFAFRRGTERAATFGGGSSPDRFAAAASMLLLVGSAGLILYVQRTDLLLLELLRGLVLAVLYAVIGTFCGRPFVYLGLWLFALCAVIALRYLGFAPLVIELFGGLSLVACGWMLQRRSRLRRAV